MVVGEVLPAKAVSLVGADWDLDEVPALAVCVRVLLVASRYVGRVTRPFTGTGDPGAGPAD